MFDRVYLGPRCGPSTSGSKASSRGSSSTTSSTPSSSPQAGGDLAQRVTDYLAGMTDRYCIRRYTELQVPRAFAL